MEIDEGTLIHIECAKEYIRRHSDHIKKYPDCFDRGIHEKAIADNERWVREMEASLQTNPKA